MNSRERLLTALTGGKPDRLPVTTHHLMPSFLDTYVNGASEAEFFDLFGLDATKWVWDSEPATVLEETHQTAWVVERLIKNKSDIELIRDYAPTPLPAGERCRSSS